MFEESHSHIARETLALGIKLPDDRWYRDAMRMRVRLGLATPFQTLIVPSCVPEATKGLNAKLKPFPRKAESCMS